MRSVYTLLVAAVLFYRPTQGQPYWGLHTSHYSPLTALPLQPASVVDTRSRIQLLLVGAHLDANNNYLAVERNAFWSLNFDRSNLRENLDGKPKNALLGADFQAMGIMFGFSPRHALAFVPRVRTMINVNNLSESTARLLYNDLNVPELWQGPIKERNTWLQVNSWAEYALTYGRVILDKQEHFLKAGVTFKLLQGLASAYMYMNELNYQPENQDAISVFQTNLQYGHSSQFRLDQLPPYRFEARPALGFDMGIVYEWRPDYQAFRYEMDGKKNLLDRTRHAYRARLGASLTDLGRIYYDKSPESRNYLLDIQNWNIRQENINSLEDFNQVLQQRFAAIDDKGYYRMNLPTALNIQADYLFSQGIGVNLTAMWALKQGSRDIDKNHYVTTYALTPRFELKRWGIYLPASWHAYSGFNAGVALRLGTLFVGSRDLLSNALLSDKVQAASLYFGLTLDIFHKKPKDRDGDKVSDKLDQCIDVPGVWATRGCPDSDGDGVPDAEDACPYVFGFVQFKGCPDSDGDGIPDHEDECPQQHGLRVFQGCPDSDGDGVEDRKDECPYESGFEQFNGCPDSDLDGVPDKDDACPDAYGDIRHQGCPDSDGDGLYDHEDRCPDLYGDIANGGCPYIDSDGDGLRDIDDKCPEIPGPAENNGCPYSDTDGDGVPDVFDKCPEIPGPAENNGCPKLEKKEEEVLKMAFDMLEFETASTVIKATSFEALYELANLLKRKTSWKLLVEGHTDNVGNRQKNIQLSEQRALAVKRFLVEQGVEPHRIQTKGWGPDKPIDSNATPEGRQRNRRVEFTLFFE